MISSLLLRLAVIPIVLTVGVIEVEETDCKSRINHHRTKYGVEPQITEREELHSCVNRQSQYDKQMGAHKSYPRCGATGSQGQGGGSNCANVIDAFVNERWRCTETPVLGTHSMETTQGSFVKCRQACMDDASCLSFDFDANSTSNNCRFYEEASLTHAHVDDNGALWLGAPDYTNSEPSTVDSWESFSMIEVDGSNAIPADGKISGFKWYGSDTNGVNFFIYRLKGDPDDRTYEVVKKLQASSTSVGVENTITANPALDVQKGDVIGWTWNGLPAFGFTSSNDGQIYYKDGDKSGGPTAVGDEWTFNKGPLGRRYHMAASFIPTETLIPTESINYCAAALCQGHCGPVMSGRTTTFAWGEWNNFYTLNWRPNARLPSGGSDCPSGIEAVKCWEDTTTGVLWAYGVGGGTCHTTCSLAGATPADYKCDENTPITGGLQEVSNIMSNFENVFNANDEDEFTCTKGACWNGESSTQIRIHEYNSNCYFPSNTAKYACDSRLGNANCYNQRFNQVCPCVPGCETTAAGPSCSPVATPSPTPSPSKTPSSTNNSCQDSEDKFEYGKKKKMKSCRFIKKKNVAKRCRNSTVKENCPVTCEAECMCYDTIGLFNINNKGNKEKDCSWVEKKPNNRCKKDKVYANCPIICGACDDPNLNP